MVENGELKNNKQQKFQFHNNNLIISRFAYTRGFELKGKKMKTTDQVSNLERFLNFTTPRIRSQVLQKKRVQDLNTDWQPMGRRGRRIEYFNLGDLWDFYDEWSAYGVGSPFISTYNHTVVQYFTPYLSAIQIYTDKSIPPLSVVDSRDDTDGESESKSWTSSESEDEKLSRSSSNSDRTWEMDDMGSFSLSDRMPTNKNRLGKLYFEYFESDLPFGRVPLKDKIDELAHEYPLLKSLDSVELSPASWMAVAWYPIYHIPPSRNLKESYASFLTYHTLSSCFQDFTVDMDNADIAHAAELEKLEVNGKDDGYNSISLHPFGLAVYKMQLRAWLNPTEPSDHENLSSLVSAAASWLKQLGVHHPDFDYFNSYTSGDRT